MFQLLVMANEWHHKYGIFTNILFAEYWGPIGDGSKFLKDLSYLQSIKQFHIKFPLDSKIIIEKINKIKERMNSTVNSTVSVDEDTR